jgi:rSAM-associated Gly-rich repeat protein
MSLRQKYLRILSGMAPVGAIGVSLLLGSTAPVVADQDPASAQPQAADHGRVSERLAAIRAAVSAVEGDEAAKAGDMRTVWWGNGGWRNGGWRNGGWRNGGWRNGGWRNFWRNW